MIPIERNTSFDVISKTKAGIYRGEVKEATIKAIKEFLKVIKTEDFTPLKPTNRPFHKYLTQDDRKIDWQNNTTCEIMKKINFGNLGAFINLLSYVFGGALSIVGCSMILITLKKLSKQYNDESIFKNYLYAYILFVSSIVFSLFVFGSSIMKYISNPQLLTINNAVYLLIFGVIIYSSVIVGTYFIRKAYTNLSKYANMEVFNKIGKLYFYGALLSIVGIGIIMVFIAQFLEIKAYSDISDKVK